MVGREEAKRAVWWGQGQRAKGKVENGGVCKRVGASPLIHLVLNHPIHKPVPVSFEGEPVERRWHDVPCSARQARRVVGEGVCGVCV